MWRANTWARWARIDNSIVAVTTLRAREERYYPLDVAPYTPEKRLAQEKQDLQFRTKPQIALYLIEQAQAADIVFSAIVADCFNTCDGLNALRRSNVVVRVVMAVGLVRTGTLKSAVYSLMRALTSPRQCFTPFIRAARPSNLQPWRPSP